MSITIIIYFTSNRDKKQIKIFMKKNKAIVHGFCEFHLIKIILNVFEFII